MVKYASYQHTPKEHHVILVMLSRKHLHINIKYLLGPHVPNDNVIMCFGCSGTADITHRTHWKR